MVFLTKPQRQAVKRIHERVKAQCGTHSTAPAYRAFRRTVHPGPGCVMLPYAGMWLGIEPDGYTHS